MYNHNNNFCTQRGMSTEVHESRELILAVVSNHGQNFIELFFEIFGRGR